MLSNFSVDDLNDTIDAIPASIAVLKVEPDDQFRIIAINPRMTKIYGLSHDEAMGREVSEFRFEDAVKDELRQHYIMARDAKRSTVLDNEVVTEDGIVLWTTRTMVPLFDDNNEVEALIITVQDITELAATRRALSRSLSALASGFVTICAWCRKVQDEGEWIPLEEFVSADPASQEEVICPECQERT